MLMVPAMGLLAEAEDDFTVNEGELISYNGKEAVVTIPDNVTTIAGGAFENSKISSVVIPSNVLNIGEAAFYGCENLESVDIAEGVKTICNSAFADCPSLYSINIPSTVTDIGLGVFADDVALSSLSVYGDKYFFNDGALYNADSTELICYLPGSGASEYEMPFSVKKIDKYAFWGADKLKNVRVSNNVEYIPAYAFSGCYSLEMVYLPESVKRIDDYAFYNCHALSYLASENANVKTSSTALTGCENAETYYGVTSEQAQREIKLRKKHAMQEAQRENNPTAENVVLTGAVGYIHDGEVTILDVISNDPEDSYAPLESEIGAGKTSNGSVNVYVDIDKGEVGVVTPDKQAEREAKRLAAKKQKEEEEKRRQEEERMALIKKMEDLRNNAFSNWKN